MIEFRNVGLLKAGYKIFEQLNFKIESHDNYVIQGGNGSGKTFLLQLISGMIAPSSGEVSYDFIRTSDLHERYNMLRDSLHYIPAHALQAFLSGYHQLFYQQRYYSIGDMQLPRVRDFFNEDRLNFESFKFPPSLNIESLMELELHRLSNGQLKKLLITRNLIKEIPRVLLLDYPFEGLDAGSRKDLCDFIDHIAAVYGIQIILVDHHHELPRAITRRLVLHEFKVKAIETITKDNSAISPFVAKAMNCHCGNSNEPVVEMKEVTIQYGKTKIIEKLNWKINKGERWALTGKNGSGKTTLFSMIYADHPMAYSQQVYLFGKRRGTGESIWDIKNRINYLGPEQIHFMNPGTMGITVHDYLAEGRTATKARLQGLIDFFNLHALTGIPMRCLSSGQLQLALLIRFFLTDKELLLLDEPFQFLDPVTKQSVNEYLSHYLDPDITLILITHYEEDLAAWTQLRMSL